MESTLTLTTTVIPDITLPLISSYTAFTGKEAVNIVYQDLVYDFVLKCQNNEVSISNIEIIVNSKLLEIDYVIEQTNSEIVIFIHPIKSSHPFDLIYGVTEIIVHLEYDDDSEQYLFTGHLAVAIEQRYSSTMDSIKEMLDDIYKQDHSLLHKGKHRNRMDFPKYLQNRNNKYEEEINTIKSIINTLKRNLPYFMQNPRTRAIPEYHIDSIEKLHTVNSQNLSYMATHPEQLKRASGAFGILVNNHHMVPDKTLVNSKKFSLNTHENQIVLSFVYTLLCHANNRRDEIMKALDTGLSSIALTSKLRENYILSTAVIQQYTQFAFKEYISALNEIFAQFANLLAQYKRALSCDFFLLRRPPEPTPIFLEVYHYRNLFEAMNLWFGLGDFSIPTKNILLHFSSADTIYEHYCLLVLYDVIISLGFSEIAERRSAYKYEVRNPFYMNTDEDNTFCFQNGGCEITLYYQPVIYSDFRLATNNISLFRTDRSYFTPDFIIKKQTDTGIYYGIIDAKWRNRSALMNKDREGSFFDSVFKYLFSIVDKQTLKSASMFWLLEGKDSLAPVGTYFHHSGKISKKQLLQYQYSTGIVSLTPKSGVSELTKILKAFMFS